MSVNTRALRLAEIIAIPETVRDYQILLGLLEGICGLPPAEPMLDPNHELGYQLGAEIYAELAGRPSTMAASIRKLHTMRETELDMVTVSKGLLTQSLEALRCSDAYIGCGMDHTEKRASAIRELERALRAVPPTKAGGKP